MAIIKKNKIKRSTLLDPEIDKQVKALNESERRDSVSATIAMLVREALATRRIMKEKAA